MKVKIALLAGLLLAGANAMACYTVYDGSSRVVYQGVNPPVDMSLPLHQAMARRFPASAQLVFDQGAPCRPVGMAQVPRAAGGDVPPNTIRIERSGARAASRAPAPLFTDLETAQRNNLPHTQVAGGIVVVPPAAADRAIRPTVTVVPSSTFAAAPRAPDTSTLGAGPARMSGSTSNMAMGARAVPVRQVVITEFRDGNVTVTK